jgi:ElaB/YqjD/DUF883 family membrane-anchored ribosome-binding protein
MLISSITLIALFASAIISLSLSLFMFTFLVNPGTNDHQYYEKFQIAKSRYLKQLQISHELRKEVKSLTSQLEEISNKYNELSDEYNRLKEQYIEILQDANKEINIITIRDNGDFKLRIESSSKDDWIKYKPVMQELIDRANARYKLPYNLDVVVRYCGMPTYAALSPYYLDGRHLGIVMCAEYLNSTANFVDLYVKYYDPYTSKVDAFRILIALVFYHEVGHTLIYLAGLVKGSGEEAMADDFAVWNVIKDKESIETLKKIVDARYGNTEPKQQESIQCLINGMLNAHKRYEGDRCSILWYEVDKTWSKVLKQWIKQ